MASKKMVPIKKVVGVFLVSALITLSVKVYGSIDRANEREFQESGLVYVTKWDFFKLALTTKIYMQLQNDGFTSGSPVLDSVNYLRLAKCDSINKNIPDDDIEKAFFWKICVLMPKEGRPQELSSVNNDLVSQIAFLRDGKSPNAYMDKYYRYEMLYYLMGVYGNNRDFLFDSKEERIEHDNTILQTMLFKFDSADIKFILERYGNRLSFLKFILQSQKFIQLLHASEDYNKDCPEDLIYAWKLLDAYIARFLPIAHQIDAHYPDSVLRILAEIETNRERLPFYTQCELNVKEQ